MRTLQKKFYIRYNANGDQLETFISQVNHAPRGNGWVQVFVDRCCGVIEDNPECTEASRTFESAELSSIVAVGTYTVVFKKGGVTLKSQANTTLSAAVAALNALYGSLAVFSIVDKHVQVIVAECATDFEVTLAYAP